MTLAAPVVGLVGFDSWPARPWASATAQTQNDREEKRAKDDLDTEQTKIGQSAARAAWIAVGFTVAAAIVALIAWVLPHLWG